MGLCHRNLSLDSIDLNGDIAIINGLGWCLRFNKIAPIGTDKSLLVPGGDNSQFVAPEYFGRLDGSWNGFAADIWATGLILYSMVVGTEALFAAPVEEDKRFVALCIKGAIRESAEKYAKSVQREAVLSDELVTLLEKMLQADPEKRYSLDEVLEHPWVANEHLVAPSTREKIRMRDSVSAIYQGNS